MDKKTSTCITGLLVCAMLYANVSITRADIRTHDVDNFALAYVSARPAVSMLPAASSRPNEATGKPVPAEALPAAQRHFEEYLQLHRSRVEMK